MRMRAARPACGGTRQYPALGSSMRAWAWWVALMTATGRARELDPAACAPRFDVQRDKIIRTEESREMGARYLAELDVGARAECLRLCCETDACDVFVYEEKSPGSCYLFNCGPPEDFRCKFTAHSNFSSGVLALSRRLAELQDQERLARHEQELANLRSVTSTTASTSTTLAARTPASRAPHPFEPPQPPPRRCSRYQFECHSGGECIAVYNACDGVPQCADGSDEAPELGCPPAAATAPVPVPAPAPTSTAPPPPPAPAATTTTPSSRAMQVESSDLGIEGEGLTAEVAAPDRWPHRLTQAQPQHRYNEAGPSSHIFSHKGGLLQEPEPPLAQYAAFEPPWPRRPWIQQTVDAGSAGDGDARGWGGGFARGDWAEPDPRRAWPVPPRAPDVELPVYTGPKTMPELPLLYGNQPHTLRDTPKKGFELASPAAPPTQPPPPVPPAAPASPPRSPPSPSHTEITTKKVVKEETAASKSGGAAHAEHAPAHEPFSATHDEHDGLSEHPPAAVLLLVLGILMTTVMGAMLGCRARAARRRLRRGKSPFAHDADYLVNGMYL